MLDESSYLSEKTNRYCDGVNDLFLVKFRYLTKLDDNSVEWLLVSGAEAGNGHFPAQNPGRTFFTKNSMSSRERQNPAWRRSAMEGRDAELHIPDSESSLHYTISEGELRCWLGLGVTNASVDQRCRFEGIYGLHTLPTVLKATSVRWMKVTAI